MAAKKSKQPTFEAGLERLEAIAAQMERSELPLDELMKLYEEGIKLSADLNSKLDAAENRMTEVRLGRDGEVVMAQTEVVAQQSLLDGLMDK